MNIFSLSKYPTLKRNEKYIEIIKNVDPVKKNMSIDEQKNVIVEADIINDPSCSHWLKEQILLERDPIDMLNDIDTLSAVIKNRMETE